MKIKVKTLENVIETEALEHRIYLFKQIKASLEQGALSLDLLVGGWENVPVFVQLLTNLRCLKLSDAVTLSSLSGIKNLPFLDTIVVDEAHNLTELGMINLPELKIFHLSHGHKLIKLDELKNFPSIKELKIRDLPLLTHLESLQNLPNLEVLSLDDISSLTTLEGLEKLPSIVHLGLEGKHELTTLQGVEKLPALRMLTLPRSNNNHLLRSLGNLSVSREVNVVQRFGNGLIRIGHFVQQMGAIVYEAQQHISCKTLFIDDVHYSDYPIKLDSDPTPE